MRRLFLLFSVSIFAFLAGAVTRQWDEGPLTWSDFKGEPSLKTSTSYFKGVLKTETEIEQQSKSKFKTDYRYATSAVALMDCSASYSDSAYQTDQMLRYHQLQFDMLEVVRRRLQSDLNIGMAGLEADNRVAYYQRIYEEQLSDLAKATDGGQNDQKLQQYEYMTRKQLDEFKLSKVPDVKPCDWQIGWFVGTGCFVPFGDISSLLNYAWIFNIGLSGGYKRFILKADISYGQPGIKNYSDFTFNPLDISASNKDAQVHSDNEYVKLLLGSISLGYRIIDTKHFALTPHVGGSWTNYSWYSAEYQKTINSENETLWNQVTETSKKSFHNFNFMFGIDFDWRFHSTVSDKSTFLSGKREQYTSSLRLTPYIFCYKYKNLNPVSKGIYLGISLTYSGFLRALGFE